MLHLLLPMIMLKLDLRLPVLLESHLLYSQLLTIRSPNTLFLEVCNIPYNRLIWYVKGHILGRSARSKPGDLSYPVHVMSGSTQADSEEEERFLFVQLKHFKAKSGSLRASEIGFAFASFGSLAGALHHDLPIFKKPVDFTMDPKKLSKSGGRMVIRVEAPKAEAKGHNNRMIRSTSATSPISKNGFDI